MKKNSQKEKSMFSCPIKASPQDVLVPDVNKDLNVVAVCQLTDLKLSTSFLTVLLEVLLIAISSPKFTNE